MITKEAIEAALNAYYGNDVEHGRMAMAQMEAALTAAFAAMPAGVRVNELEWEVSYEGASLREIAKTSIGDYSVWLGGSVYFNGQLVCVATDTKASAFADYEARILSALTPAPDPAAENERLRAALERQGDNMAFVINHATLPEQWMTKFMAELAEDRAALERT